MAFEPGAVPPQRAPQAGTERLLEQQQVGVQPRHLFEQPTASPPAVVARQGDRQIPEVDAHEANDPDAHAAIAGCSIID
jgi:hypothetical protein